jgi:hypothetical protein
VKPLNFAPITKHPECGEARTVSPCVEFDRRELSGGHDAHFSRVDDAPSPERPVICFNSRRSRGFGSTQPLP